MPRHNKTILLILALLLLTGFTTAVTLQDVQGTNIVWKNADYDQNELTAQCDTGNIDRVYLDSQNQTLIESTNDSEANLTTSDFSALPNEANAEIMLNCSENETLDSYTVDLAELHFNVQQKAVGFVGDIMKNESGSLGNRAGLKVQPEFKGTDYNINDLEKDDFSFDNSLNLDDGEVQIAENENAIYLYPRVDSFPTYPVNLNVSSTALGFSKEYLLQNEESEIFVHEWSAERVGNRNPGRDMNYEAVEEGDYQYYLDMTFRDRQQLPESDPLDSHNFVLTVKKQSEDGNYESISKEDDLRSEKYDSNDYTDMEILKQESPESSSDANYRVFVDEFSKLDNLRAGKYKFILEVKYDSKKPEDLSRQFKVDEVRVDKSSEFSGLILNADGNGVKTFMELRGDDTTQNVESTSDGFFSTEINQNSYNLDAQFYDTTDDTSATPDAEASLNEITLDNADLGPGRSAINFHYWNNPETSIEGLKPVNMMATKFGYPIEGGINELRMSFDSGELNPDDMKVYQCGEWNFEGEDCMSSWNQISNDNLGINYATWEAIIDGNAVNEYDAEGDNILMGAYVIGTSSDLQLQQSISLESTDLTYNQGIGTSGVLVDETGDRVEDAKVTLSLKGTDQEWNTTTDSTGTFQFDNKVKAEPGNYVLELEAEKAPYNSFSTESSATVQVSYEKGIETEAPADQSIKQGEPTSVEFDVTNTGQTEVENLDVSVSGVKSQFIKSVNSVQTIESGDTETVTVHLELPEDYCSSRCYPELNADIEGEAEGQTVTASALLTTTLEPVQDNQENDTSGTNDEQDSDEEFNDTENTSSEQPDDESNSVSGAFSDAQRMTGEFVESQSDLNIALGLIMIFTMILAAAVKKKQSQNGGRESRMDDRSRPNIAGGTASTADSRVQRPDVSPKKDREEKTESRQPREPREEESSEPEAEESVPEPEEEVSNTDEEESIEEESEDLEENTEEEEEVPENVCDICGEEFKNATGVKIHKQAMH